MASPEKKDLIRPLRSKGKTPGRSRRERNDRFIPNRGGTDYENVGLLQQLDTGASERQCELARQFSVGCSRVLSFKNSKPKPAEALKQDDTGPNSRAAARSHRYIPPQPDRVLDAPDMLDDFYSNVLDWGANNQLMVALGSTLYLWNGDTGDVDLFQEFDDPLHMCSVKWSQDGDHVAIGMSDHTVQLYDVKARKQLRCMRGQPGRVNALSWNHVVLASAGKGGVIMNSDVRVKQHAVSTVEAHKGEVCGLAWSPSRSQLASGGDDKLLAVWDGRQPSVAAHKFTEHTAAVKAIAWSPHQRKVLASGGGERDQHVRIWDTNAGSQLAAIDTKAQVCSLVWNPYEKEILGGLGGPTEKQCQLRLWRWPSCNHVVDLDGHTQRVLHLALSSDGCTVCSGSADETLRFWKIFDKPAPLRNALKSNNSVLQSRGIR
eukprot:jgi/Ulvmu1/2037/UM120_0033.1